MVTITEEEERVIKNLKHPLFTADFVKEYVNRSDHVALDPQASLRTASAKGFYEAVHAICACS